MELIRAPFVAFVGFILGIFVSAEPSKKTTSLAAIAINDFSCELLNVLPFKQQNIFFSPFSISVALSMTSLGAEKNTLDEIKKTLHFNDVEGGTSDSMAIHKFFREVLENTVEENSNYQLSLANRLFLQNDFNTRKSFQEKAEKYYNASVGHVNFGSGEAEDIVNKWVEDQTKNKIKDLFVPGTFSSETVLVLVNAIYFKGMWRYEFDKALTEDDEFHLADKSTKTVKMMSRTATFFYADDDDLQCQVLMMPYRGNHLSMVIFLPKGRNNLADIIPRMHAQRLQSVFDELEPRQVNVKLPRIKLENKFMLKDTLEQLGINDLFDNRADLSGMSDAELKVSSVVHKAFVDINEKGTEAAAATGVVVNLKSMMPSKPVNFIVNQPFFFTIIDERFENTILFAGTVIDPQK